MYLDIVNLKTFCAEVARQTVSGFVVYLSIVVPIVSWDDHVVTKQKKIFQFH